MRSIAQSLVNAGHAPVSKPIGKAEIVAHPSFLGGPLKFTAFSTMSGTGPRCGVELDNGDIVICDATTGFKLITDPEDTSQWQVAWVAWGA